MKKHQYGKIGLVVCVAALFATMQARAAEGELQEAIQKINDGVAVILRNFEKAGGKASPPPDNAEDAGNADKKKKGWTPNVHDVLWESEGLRSLYRALFETSQSALGFEEEDATSI